MEQVLIAGAGPVGLFAAILLARAGISVTVLESLEALDSAAKSIAHSPVLLADFKAAGILEDVDAIALTLATDVHFRRMSDKSIIAKLPTVLGRPLPRIVSQDQFCALLYRHTAKYDNVKVLFGHAVEEVDNSAADKVTVTVKASGTLKQFTANYLIGADGGRSTVRNACGIPFEGETLPHNILAADVYYPFDKVGWTKSANFMVDPQHFGMIGPINDKGLWRIGFTLPEDIITPEQIAEAVPAEFELLFPGPRPLEYKLERVSRYRPHQLCAQSFRQGRVTLVGDAAHLTNPFAGMGLTSGLLDAASLVRVLQAHIQRGAPDVLLDSWAKSRRSVFVDAVDPISRQAYLSMQDPDKLVERHPMLVALKAGPNAKPPALVTDVTTLEGWIA